VDTFDVLTLAGVAAKPAVPGGCQLRHLRDDADWLASAELAAQIAIEEG
jgi:hypothetical protein